MLSTGHSKLPRAILALLLGRTIKKHLISLFVLNLCSKTRTFEDDIQRMKFILLPFFLFFFNTRTYHEMSSKMNRVVELVFNYYYHPSLGRVPSGVSPTGLDLTWRTLRSQEEEDEPVAELLTWKLGRSQRIVPFCSELLRTLTRYKKSRLSAAKELWPVTTINLCQCHFHFRLEQKMLCDFMLLPGKRKRETIIQIIVR